MALATLFFCLCLLCACSKPDKTLDQGERAVSLADTAMGTVAQLTLYGQGEEYAEDLIRQVKQLEEEILSSKLDSSEVAKMNQQSAHEGAVTEISSALGALLKDCLQMSADSDGAFDVTLGVLCKLWSLDEIAAGEKPAKVPSEDEIRDALSHCGWEKIALREENAQAYALCLEEGMALEMGSVGKGYALDRLRELWKSQEGARPYAGVVALGGSIWTFGEKADGTPWKIGIADPQNPGGIIGYLEIRGECFVSTSGDYERFFEVNGEKYHHIMDPQTGFPARSGLHSVTVLAPNGFLSDALSTACFVLGRARGMELAEKYGAEVLMVDDAGEVWMSEGCREAYHAKER